MINETAESAARHTGGKLHTRKQFFSMPCALTRGLERKKS